MNVEISEKEKRIDQFLNLGVIMKILTRY